MQKPQIEKWGIFDREEGSEPDFHLKDNRLQKSQKRTKVAHSNPLKKKEKWFEQLQQKIVSKRDFSDKSESDQPEKSTTIPKCSQIKEKTVCFWHQTL